MHPRRPQRLGLLAASVLVLSGGVTSAAVAAPSAPADSVSWTLGPPSPFAGTRFDGEYVAATARIYFLGFRTTGDATDGSVWYFDVASRAYVDTGVDMPVPVSNYGIAALDDSRGEGFYIFGGRDAGAQIVDTVQAFYPSTGATRTFPSDPWPGRTPAGCVSLPAMGATVLRNQAYVLGGLSFAANGCVDDQSAETWVFDPRAANGSRWSQGPDLNVARGYITPAVLQGRIYAIGGDTNSAGTLIPDQTVESWAPPSGSWDNAGVADLPQPCDESQAFGFAKGPAAGSIILAGCGQWPNAVPDTLQYNSMRNGWVTVGAFNENRRNHAGALYPVGRRFQMFILGGYGEPGGFIDPLFTSEIGRVSALSGEKVGASGSASKAANPAAATN
jgi:hypothetical protein